jgi:hypothetical protein
MRVSNVQQIANTLKIDDFWGRIKCIQHTIYGNEPPFLVEVKGLTDYEAKLLSLKFEMTEYNEGRALLKGANWKG